MHWNRPKHISEGINSLGRSKSKREYNLKIENGNDSSAYILQKLNVSYIAKKNDIIYHRKNKKSTAMFMLSVAG